MVQRGNQVKRTYIMMRKARRPALLLIGTGLPIQLFFAAV